MKEGTAPWVFSMPLGGPLRRWQPMSLAMGPWGLMAAGSGLLSMLRAMASQRREGELKTSCGLLNLILEAGARHPGYRVILITMALWISPTFSCSPQILARPAGSRDPIHQNGLTGRLASAPWHFEMPGRFFERALQFGFDQRSQNALDARVDSPILIADFERGE